jgi:putative ABC transport system permease protein
VLGFAVALLSGALGAFMGARPMLRLAPGEAMRPPAPRKVTRDALKSLGPVRFLLAGSGRMAVRNISRSGFRSLFVTVGIAFSFALIAFLGSYDYMFDIMLVEQFSKVQVYGLKIALTEPRPHVQTLEAAWRLDGVEQAEAILELPAELRLNHLKKAATVTGLATGRAVPHLRQRHRNGQRAAEGGPYPQQQPCGRAGGNAGLPAQNHDGLYGKPGIRGKCG